MFDKKNKNIYDLDKVMSNFLGRPFKWIIITCSFFLVTVPLYWLFTSSIKYEKDYLASPPVLIPSEVTFNNFVKIFVDDGIGNALFNSIVITTSTTIIAVFIGSLAAYALAKGNLPKKARNFFIFWFLIQKMYPAIATAIPIFLVMRNLGLIDTKLSLIIMNTSFNLPLVIWLMLGFFQDIPNELIESGKIDGCNMWQRFLLIVLPITKPGLIASAILTFVATWNEFLFAVILSIRIAKPLTVVIAGFITDRGLEWGPMSAAGVVTIVPVVIIVWGLQKNFVKGLALGAVKE